MYCEFFGLQQKPFNLTPNPRFLFLSRQHRDALAHLLYGLRSRCGFIGISGEVGTGKTTLLRSLLQEIDNDDFRIALIFNPWLSSLDLLRAINREFDLPSLGVNVEELHNQLNHFLLAETLAGRTVVLIIDEAQNLAPEVLEQIRLLSNLETDSEKLLQIVLVGQPELDQLLKRKDLRQLNQRIAVRCQLDAMTQEESAMYVRHRLQVAGGNSAAQLFSAPALKAVFRYSQGIPRVINLLCDRALLISFGHDRPYVDFRSVDRAAVELRGTLKGGAWRPKLSALGLFYWLQELGFRKRMSSVPVQPPLHLDDLAEVPDNLVQDGGQNDFNRQAFNVLACMWQIPPLPPSVTLNTEEDIVRVAKDIGLQLIPFSGDLDMLLNLKCPALLKLVDDDGSLRFLAFCGIAEEKARISPPWEGKTRVTYRELAALWQGRGILVWKNGEWLSCTQNGKLRGRHIYRLQYLLKATGWLTGQVSGQLDDSTLQALKEFQSACGLLSDGKLGYKTLTRLIAEADRIGFSLKGEPKSEENEQHS